MPGPADDANYGFLVLLTAEHACRCQMPGERIPSGKVQMVLVTEMDTLTRQTTPVAGFLPRTKGSPRWMTMTAWQVSKLETSGSWTIC